MAQRPDDPQPPFDLAGLLAADGRADEAAKLFDQAAEIDPRRAERVASEKARYRDAYQDQAQEQFDAGNLEEASRRLDQADAMEPAHVRTELLRGKIAWDERRIAEAAEHFRHPYAQDHSSEALTGLCDALSAQGREAYQAAKYARAWDLLTEAQEIESRPDLHLFLGTVAYSWAQTLPVEDRRPHLEDARAAFERALRAHPEDDDARFNLATSLLAIGDYAGAADLYKKMVARDPENGNFYMALARAHSLSGDSGIATTEEAIGRALTVGEPVHDPPSWASRSADRFARSHLAGAYREAMAPQAIRTYSLPGGGLVEVWFYWDRGVIEAFREGARLGPAFTLDR